ncbi:MAG TPA: helix-turn-helix transcriptional regulator [Gemmatimonadaceae bacterium]|nr:helix-turn-helix transcriptional regulator [Gemmatimonadaceae bacterium]
MTVAIPHASGRPSVVLHELAREHHHDEPAGTGRLSIKCILSGEARYAVGRARYVVRPGAFLVLNAGSPYLVDIRSRAERVESLCVFFGDDMAADVLRTLVTPADRLLDRPEPGALGGQSPRFFERLHAFDWSVAPAVLALRAAASRGADRSDAAALAEGLPLLLGRLVGAHRLTVRDAERLPAARPATRLELYRRACVARDYLDASLAAGAPLAELARAAALSPYHLLRVFRHAFGETPHQYLTRRRLERAAELLARPDASVTRACMEVGFESVGSFSALFKRRYRVSPSDWRRGATTVG